MTAYGRQVARHRLPLPGPEPVFRLLRGGVIVQSSRTCAAHPVIRPRLHHCAPLGQMLSIVVVSADGVWDTVGHLSLDRFGSPSQFVEQLGYPQSYAAIERTGATSTDTACCPLIRSSKRTRECSHNFGPALTLNTTLVNGSFREVPFLHPNQNRRPICNALASHEPVRYVSYCGYRFSSEGNDSGSGIRQKEGPGWGWTH
jgi:hypothetical protein